MAKLRSVIISFLELLLLFFLAYGVVKIVHRFVFQPFYVVGSSMEPNFFDHDYLIVEKIKYRFESPERGEVIVLHTPSQPSSLIIKRIIGLPGETVIIRDGQVFLEKKNSNRIFKLQEPYLPVGTETPGDLRLLLAKDEYFVMGDHRNRSLDSRSFGPVKRRMIIGRVWLRIWPFHSFGLIRGLNYAN